MSATTWPSQSDCESPGAAAAAIAVGSTPAGDRHPSACEAERLAVLRSRRLLDTEACESFDRITRLAGSLFGAPIALVTLMDADRLWFKSRLGVDARETPRSTAICDHTIRSSAVMVVENLAQDARFSDSPMLADGYHFYAGAPLRTRSGHALGTLCILDKPSRRFDAAAVRQLNDMAAMVMSQIELHQAVGRTDEVTGLPNRSQLVADLEDLCALYHRSPRTLVLLEACGHDRLQEAQQAIGSTPLESTMRDFAARLVRWAGESTTVYKISESRFAFLLPGHSSDAHEAHIRALAQRLQAGDRGPKAPVTLDFSPSFGMATFELDAESSGDVLRRAASALHQARRAQADLAWFTPEADASSRRAFALLQDVPRALSEGEFRLVYQPKMDLRTRLYRGVEALIRWRHPQLGELSPGEFIPLVENSPLIHPVTEWVLHTALAQLAQWEAEGLSVTMAVNVSAKNLEHPDFLKVLRNACALHAVQPCQLHIECTENAVLYGQQTAQVLRAVRALGVQVSLDDFGVGYSNFSCLHSLPAELLKLDQSLIKHIATDRRAWKLLESIIEFGHALGYQLLAEGVESAEVFDMLESSGCDAVQGYYLARPLEAADLVAMLKRHVELFTLDR